MTLSFGHLIFPLTSVLFFLTLLHTLLPPSFPHFSLSILNPLDFLHPPFSLPSGHPMIMRLSPSFCFTLCSSFIVFPPPLSLLPLPYPILTYSTTLLPLLPLYPSSSSFTLLALPFTSSVVHPPASLCPS